ncbi:MAG: MoaD/ThiS family protein [Hyphomicrobiaceae bacterium]
MSHYPIDHNSQDATISIEVRLFNKLYDPTQKRIKQHVQLPVGSQISDLIEQLKLTRNDIYLVMINGTDITPGRVGDPINLAPELEDGDVVALSGPVPMSGGYGSAIV